jgi:hypothetical protein
MRNLFFRLGKFGRHFLQEPNHSFLPIEDGARLLVAGDEILYFLLQTFIDALVFEDGHEALVDLGVNELVLTG